MPAGPALKPDPDWVHAAQVLIDGCAHAAGESERAELLERLTLGLGDALYPAFLEVLTIVGERGSESARRAVAEALSASLASGRMPAARRGAWGAGGTAGGERLGPIEYLVGWGADGDARGQRPSSALLDRKLRAVLQVVCASTASAARYAARLRAQAEDPPEGILSRSARRALGELAQAWNDGAAPGMLADAVLTSLRRDALPMPALAMWPGPAASAG